MALDGINSIGVGIDSATKPEAVHLPERSNVSAAPRVLESTRELAQLALIAPILKVVEEQMLPEYSEAMTEREREAYLLQQAQLHGFSSLEELKIFIGTAVMREHIRTYNAEGGHIVIDTRGICDTVEEFRDVLAIIAHFQTHYVRMLSESDREVVEGMIESIRKTGLKDKRPLLEEMALKYGLEMPVSGRK